VEVDGKSAIPLHVNWSEELRQLLLEARIEADGIKIPDWPHCLLPALDTARSLNARSNQPTPARHVGVQVHFAFATSAGLASDHELTRCWGFLDTTDTKVVNTHFRVPKELIAGGRLEEAGLMPTALAHVERLAKRFGCEAIVVEHIPEFESLAATGCYPELLCRLVRETGVGLLLDISHARLSARHHGCTTEEYIDRLPMDRLKLIHTTGVGQDTDGTWTDHLPMDDRDYEVLSSVLRCARMGRYPVPIAVEHEYGGISGFMKRYSSAEVLAREVASLSELLS
jgi:uncharacterized protein (UPF0276 family)